LAQVFLTKLAIERLSKFPPHTMSAFTLPGKTEQAKYAFK